MVEEDPRPRLGWIDPLVADEHPSLALLWLELPVRWMRRSPRWMRDRLATLSGRVDGAAALELRRQDIPAAWRVFYRHVGIDPDEDQTPIEAAYHARLRWGGFRSRGMPRDVLTAALVETGVALWAVDADRTEGELGVRLSKPGELLGAGQTEAPAGRLVIADDHRALAPLGGEPAEELAVSKGSTRAIVYALQFTGIPSMHVHEAFWTASELLGPPVAADAAVDG